MNALLIVTGATALVGSALIGGVFFAFSSFVMPALARVPSAAGIAAMQSINVVVINRSFLSVFIGTAMLSVGIAVQVLAIRGHSHTIFILGGAALYFVGTFLVTIFRNVPLNDQLAAVAASATEAGDLWMHYLDRWTFWNHVRTVAAIGATCLLMIGIIQSK